MYNDYQKKNNTQKGVIFCLIQQTTTDNHRGFSIRLSEYTLHKIQSEYHFYNKRTVHKLVFTVLSLIF